MSLFGWLTRTPPKKSVTASDRPEVSAAATANPPANRKTERLEHREVIYGIVRDAMIRTGVLAASYKFKVLSLDAHGLDFLIMIDLADPAVSASIRRAELEATIIQAAKVRHHMTVTAVYWRVNEPVAGMQDSSDRQIPRPATPLATATTQTALRKEEAEAFKRSFPDAMPVKTPVQSAAQSRRNSPQSGDFADTEMFDPDEPAAPPRGTSYGKLS